MSSSFLWALKWDDLNPETCLMYKWKRQIILLLLVTVANSHFDENETVSVCTLFLACSSSARAVGPRYRRGFFSDNITGWLYIYIYIFLKRINYNKNISLKLYEKGVIWVTIVPNLQIGLDKVSLMIQPKWKN